MALEAAAAAELVETGMALEAAAAAELVETGSATESCQTGIAAELAETGIALEAAAAAELAENGTAAESCKSGIAVELAETGIALEAAAASELAEIGTAAESCKSGIPITSLSRLPSSKVPSAPINLTGPSCLVMAFTEELISARVVSSEKAISSMISPARFVAVTPCSANTNVTTKVSLTISNAHRNAAWFSPSRHSRGLILTNCARA